jgi:lipoate-protein ligase B
METISISRKELKKIIRETFIDVLIEKKDLIEDAVLEAIEDLGLARAMQEGRTGQFVDTKEFKRKLDSKLKRIK